MQEKRLKYKKSEESLGYFYADIIILNFSFAMMLFRNSGGVSTNKTIICFIAMQTYKELI
jgi:hypothetical protein